MKEIVISNEFSNQRVDKYVRKYLNEAPLSFIYKLFRKKDVKVNNHWVKENYLLQQVTKVQLIYFQFLILEHSLEMIKQLIILITYYLLLITY